MIDVLVIWMIVSAVLCLGSWWHAGINLRRFEVAPPVRPGGEAGWSVTVCIPARNEEQHLEACLRSVLAAADADAGSTTRVLVYDDGSEDRTPEILQRFMEADPRVSAAATRPLPDGWNGKQHACDAMGRQANTHWILFIDADVRLSTDALVRTRAALHRANSGGRSIGLLSGFPREVTRGVGEALVVPLIQFVLMVYLPIGRMRSSLDPAASAACGQFVLVERAAWLEVEGHSRLRDSMHDGVRLPRIFRGDGHDTDIFDATDVASCRMYEGFSATWRGFAKNAYEGLGSVFLLVFITILHLGGHVAPWLVLIATPAITEVGWTLAASAGASVAFQVALRVRLARRFEQSWIGVVLHPIGLVVLTALQWWSLLLHVTGRRTWRGRTN